MKVGIGSYAFRWAIGAPGFQPENPMDVFGFLKKAAESGAEVVQLCDNLPLDSYSSQEIQAVRHLADELQLEIEIGIRGSRPAQLKKSLELCSQLDARVLRMVLSDGEWSPTRQEVVRLMKDLVPDLNSRGIYAGIENHFDMLPSELVDIVIRVDDRRVGICLDPFNSVYRLIHPETTIELLAPFAVSVHVKDARVSRQNTGFYIGGCPLGQGLLDIALFLTSLESSPYAPNLFVENWMDRLDTVEATILQEEEWVKAAVETLKVKILQAEGRLL